MPEPPPALRDALNGLGTVWGVEPLSDWTWFEPEQRWFLKLKFKPRIAVSPYAPNPSIWFAVVEDSYPYGTVIFYPAQVGGFTSTFQHQNHNGKGTNPMWRRGRLCVETAYGSLRGVIEDDEDYAPGKRLAWHARRCRRWLWRAGAGMVAEQGEPFELPDFRTAGEEAIYLPRVAFNEDEQSFQTWAHSPDKGLVRFSLLNSSSVFITRRFLTLEGDEIYRPSFGRAVTNMPETHIGAFVRIPGVPVIAPWEAPSTWGGMRVALRTLGLDYVEILEDVLNNFRNGKGVLLLLGFPIPYAVGGENSLMHWQPIWLNVPTTVKGTQRRNALALWRAYERDLETILGPDTPIKWGTDLNWSPDALLSRGRMPGIAIQSEYLIIGCGALGAPLAEMLVRAGASNVGLMDNDRFDTGNLVRHTLTRKSLYKSKAEELANRLNLCGIHANACGVHEGFPPSDQRVIDWVKSHNVIIDATAAESLPRKLAKFEWGDPKIFFRIGVGIKADRLYIFASKGQRFDENAYWAALNPWMHKEREVALHTPLPKDGIGCWHPTFPARDDDMSLMAATVAKHIVDCVLNDFEDGLTVFEQVVENGLFVGMRRVNEA